MGYHYPYYHHYPVLVIVRLEMGRPASWHQSRSGALAAHAPCRACAPRWQRFAPVRGRYRRGGCGLSAGNLALFSCSYSPHGSVECVPLCKR